MTPVSALTNTIDLLLGSEKDAEIRSLLGDAKNATKLQGYVYEALRMYLVVGASTEY